ncbi:MLO-like protein 9 isoform X2 [Mangifera indica]|uniref:MLO-like protein 9 isoform X2 n=1 Tax=Mangifera indica TaxID=29780 RepID=UPI001CF9D66C|nr:MLO-like protein 9 isoform X2 [Mangifera indica]
MMGGGGEGGGGEGGGGGSGTSRELDHTPTWAVALVVSVIVVISIMLEQILHLLGRILKKRRKFAIYEALEKIKDELMLLGFISLLLSFGQSYIAEICIASTVAETMLPCPKGVKEHFHKVIHGYDQNRRRLLWNERRSLGGGGGGGKGCPHGYVPLISINGIHQLHIFIFFLAAFHVFYSAVTMMLGRAKIRKWKEWEEQTQAEYAHMNDPTRFRLTHETSFVRNHTNQWMQTAFSFYVVHLAPRSNFDFQKYIKRSLEDDFKVVVGISPVLWASTCIFLLLNVHGWTVVMQIVSVTPLIVILAVGTKLQGIISQMAFEIKERHAVIQGIPLVQVSDSYFWFHRPQLILDLIHFVLFMNAFEITYFFWIWYEFGLNSCFHDDFMLAIIRVVLGVAIQFLCSYSTLPLYALVTQMGSNMKRSIFDEQTSKALKEWHKKAHKKTEVSVHKKSEGSVKKNEQTTAIPIQPLRDSASIAMDDNKDQHQQQQQHHHTGPSPQQPPDLLS